jgi:dTDP-4-dehydrorhamnose reductase
LLITGGSGYLGSHLVRFAPPTWHTHATYLSHPFDHPGVIAHPLDVRDATAVWRLWEMLAPNVVIHTAASYREDELQSVIVDGTRHVAQATQAVGARLIHLSTDLVFDGRQGRYREEDPPTPIMPYGQAKAAAEEIVRETVADAVIVRTSLIYGWDPVDRGTRWVLDSLREGRPIHLFTDELRCPIWVESLARAVLELAAGDYRGVLHIAGTQALSRYEFGVRLARFHGLDPQGLTPARSRDSGLTRPLDCTLDVSRAQALLRTPLPGVDEVLTAPRITHHAPRITLTNHPVDS